MKITVLTITILMLVAGLAMVQMDANTENQIQVLRETEMLTTQGLGVDCKRPWPNDVPAHNKCKPKDCHVVVSINGIPLIVSERVSHVYEQCTLFSPIDECVPKIFKHEDGSLEQIWQPCATTTYYWFVCDPGTKLDEDTVQTEQLMAVPGCGIDVDVVVGGATSS